MIKATTLEQIEGVPTGNWPNINFSAAATSLRAVAWQRIEKYIARRYSPRAVYWIVEGPGNWKPPLSPAAITAVEVVDPGANALVSASLSVSPLDGSYDLPACGPYKFSGTVGTDVTTVPDSVAEAVRRLADYLAAKPGTPGATSTRIAAGSIDLRTDRSESWMAQAMQNSGAADLLRGYRRV
ncbi:hypothetical protein [Bradyrhizobium sp. 27S5]|uniref:hypothetical protein n=1 Tax=Bradyrhizobium sp. 27S5 TaxID=3139728 RepID=UPI0030CCA37E